MKRILNVLTLAVVFFSLCSFSLHKNSTELIPTSKTDKINELIRDASADGKIDFSELKVIVTEMKGSKLNFEERLALKFNQKKISKNLMATQYSGDGGKSQLTATLLCFFLGGLGIHRFYLGYTWQGVVQLLTLGGLGIWTLIDFIRILTGSLQPKNGEYAKTLGGN